MTTAFDDAANQILGAPTPNDLFGVGGEDLFRTLAKVVHPDAVDEDRRDEATSLFARLQVLWDEFNGKDVGASGPVVISTRKRDYVLVGGGVEGDICNIYAAKLTEDGNTRNVVLKMPRGASDSDLTEREAKALKALDGKPDFRQFAPTLIETFRHKDAATREVRRVNVLESLEGFYTLDVVRQAYPDGVHPKDVAWIWRRLFVAAGVGHEVDVVHGAVVPKNIAIHPDQHGVVLLDWCYSCMENQTIPAVVPGQRQFYPPSVANKEIPTHATDLYMMAKVMVWLGGPNLPRAMRAFAQGCMVSSPPTAATLLGEFDDLLMRLWGPRKFHSFSMPNQYKEMHP